MNTAKVEIFGKKEDEMIRQLLTVFLRGLLRDMKLEVEVIFHTQEQRNVECHVLIPTGYDIERIERQLKSSLPILEKITVEEHKPTEE